MVILCFQKPFVGMTFRKCMPDCISKLIREYNTWNFQGDPGSYVRLLPGIAIISEKCLIVQLISTTTDSVRYWFPKLILLADIAETRLSQITDIKSEAVALETQIHFLHCKEEEVTFSRRMENPPNFWPFLGFCSLCLLYGAETAFLV